MPPGLNLWRCCSICVGLDQTGGRGKQAGGLRWPGKPVKLTDKEKRRYIDDYANINDFVNIKHVRFLSPADEMRNKPSGRLCVGF